MSFRGSVTTEESKTNKSFLPFLRGGLRRGDSSFETPILKVFQKKKDGTSPLTPLLNEERGEVVFTLSCKPPFYHPELVSGYH